MTIYAVPTRSRWEIVLLSARNFMLAGVKAFAMCVFQKLTCRADHARNHAPTGARNPARLSHTTVACLFQ